MTSRLDIDRAERTRAKLETYLQLRQKAAEMERQIEELEADPDLLTFAVPDDQQANVTPSQTPRKPKAQGRVTDRERIIAVLARIEEDNFDGKEVQERAKALDPELGGRVPTPHFSDHLRKLSLAGQLECVEAGKRGRHGRFPRYRKTHLLKG